MPVRVASLAVLTALACAPAPPPAPHPPPPAAEVAPLPDLDDPWLALESPADSAVLEVALPLIELRGRVGVGLQGPQDLVLTVDTSGSVFQPSGADLDGDGTIGVAACDWRHYHRVRCPSYRRWTTDFDDIVLKVEVAAALKLVGLLDARRTRMGMVKFGHSVWVEQPLGSLTDVTRALEQFRYVMRGGTDIAAAIQRSLDLFEQAPPPPAGAGQRTILLLSDGILGVSGDLTSAQIEDSIAAALERTRALRVRIFAFGVGETQGPGPVLLARLARETGGRYTPVPSARDIAVELPLVSLTGVSDVELRNESTEARGRATRIFPDGSFDGFLPLRVGENVLHVRATLEDGRSLETRARVRYAPPALPRPEDAAEREALLETLRRRAFEIDLAGLANAERRRRRLKLLELELDDPNAPLD